MPSTERGPLAGSLVERLVGFREDRPGAWRCPAPPIAKEDDVLRWLRLAAGRARDGVVSGRLRLFSRGEPIVPIPLDLLPTENDRALGAWFSRLEERLPDVALVVNGVQALDGDAWRRALPWTAAMLDERTGGASMELFVGRYRRGPFGVHKDDQDVFTFVVAGKKRFLVWPFEALAERYAVDPRARKGVHILAGVGATNLPEDVRARATVLEGEPGDVMYWPASAWHVAANASPDADGGPLTVTLGIGRFPDLGPGPLLAKVVAAAARESPLPLTLPTSGDLTVAADALWDTVLAWLGSDVVRARMTEDLVGWVSAHRFPLAPPLAPLPPAEPASAAAAMGPIAPIVRGTLAWARRGDRLVWSAGGHVARCPYHPGVERVLARLDGGEPLDETSALALLKAPGETPVEPAIARALLRAVLARSSAVLATSSAPAIADG